jgi:hypothetical protein
VDTFAQSPDEWFKRHPGGGSAGTPYEDEAQPVSTVSGT